MNKTQLILAALLSVSSAFAGPGGGHEKAENAGIDPYKQSIEREKEGYHNDVYTEFMDFLIEQYQVKKHSWDMSNRELLGAVKITVDRIRGLKKIEGPYVESRFGKKIPVGVFVQFQKQYQRLFERQLDMSPEMARQFTSQLEHEAVVAAGIKYDEYLKASGRENKASVDYSVIKKGADMLMKTSTIDATTDVPYVAGYVDNEVTTVLIDRSLNKVDKLEGYSVPSHYLLNVHERVEVIGLNDFHMTYPHAHQIALRSERLVSEAIGVPWKVESKVMERYIEKVEAKTPKMVHPHLDLTGYYFYDDVENRALIDQINALKRKHCEVIFL